MTQMGLSAAHISHLNALKEKHKSLEMQIETEQLRPSVTDIYLKRLKKQKLMLKDEIEQLQ